MVQLTTLNIISKIIAQDKFKGDNAPVIDIPAIISNKKLNEELTIIVTKLEKLKAEKKPEKRFALLQKDQQLMSVLKESLNKEEVTSDALQNDNLNLILSSFKKFKFINKLKSPAQYVEQAKYLNEVMAAQGVRNISPEELDGLFNLLKTLELAPGPIKQLLQDHYTTETDLQEFFNNFHKLLEQYSKQNLKDNKVYIVLNSVEEEKNFSQTSTSVHKGTLSMLGRFTEYSHLGMTFKDRDKAKSFDVGFKGVEYIDHEYNPRMMYSHYFQVNACNLIKEKYKDALALIYPGEDIDQKIDNMFFANFRKLTDKFTNDDKKKQSRVNYDFFSMRRMALTLLINYILSFLHLDNLAKKIFYGFSQKNFSGRDYDDLASQFFDKEGQSVESKDICSAFGAKAIAATIAQTCKDIKAEIMKNDTAKEKVKGAIKQKSKYQGDDKQTKVEEKLNRVHCLANFKNRANIQRFFPGDVVSKLNEINKKDGRNSSVAVRVDSPLQGISFTR